MATRHRGVKTLLIFTFSTKQTIMSGTMQMAPWWGHECCSAFGSSDWEFVGKRVTKNWTNAFSIPSKLSTHWAMLPAQILWDFCYPGPPGVLLSKFLKQQKSLFLGSVYVNLPPLQDLFVSPHQCFWANLVTHGDSCVPHLSKVSQAYSIPAKDDSLFIFPVVVNEYPSCSLMCAIIFQVFFVSFFFW